MRMATNVHLLRHRRPGAECDMLLVMAEHLRKKRHLTAAYSSCRRDDDPEP
jgi:hypothetical protein